MRHGWRSLSDYIEAHQKTLRLYHVYMETPKIYSLDEPTPLFLSLRCTFIYFTTYAENRVRVDLAIDAEIDDKVPNRKRARTFDYTFEANRPGGPPLIRYCGPHVGDHPESRALHHNDHHKHVFGGPKEKIELLTAESRPYVGEFINEVLNRF